MDEAAIITAKAAAVPVVITSAYLITFVMLIGVGALLVAIRKLFLLSCPFLSENAKVVAGFIDVIVFLLDVIKGTTVSSLCRCFEKVLTVKLLSVSFPGAVVGIIDVVDAVADVFGADIQPPRFVPIQFVNVNTLRRMLAEAPVVCARYVFDSVHKLNELALTRLRHKGTTASSMSSKERLSLALASHCAKRSGTCTRCRGFAT